LLDDQFEHPVEMVSERLVRKVRKFLFFAHHASRMTLHETSRFEVC